MPIEQTTSSGNSQVPLECQDLGNIVVPGLNSSYFTSQRTHDGVFVFSFWLMYIECSFCIVDVMDYVVSAHVLTCCG